MDSEIKNPLVGNQNAKDEGTGKGKNTGMAVVAYILFFIPLFTESKNDPFVKYHIKQGFVLFVVFIVSTIISRIPLLGNVASLIIDAGALVLLLIGIMNAVHGKQEALPVIGQFGEKLQF